MTRAEVPPKGTQVEWSHDGGKTWIPAVILYRHPKAVSISTADGDYRVKPESLREVSK